MKIIKFRIQNYKSITDSGDCYFSEKLTILAGKNGSGKSSILEALEDFHENRQIRSDAKPIKRAGEPRVSVSFELDDKECGEILKEIGFSGVVPKAKNYVVELSKTNKDYALAESSRDSLGFPNNRKQIEEKINSQIKKIESEYVNSGPEEFPYFDTNKSLDSFAAAVRAFIALPTLGVDDKAKLEPIVNEIFELVRAFYSGEDTCSKFVVRFVEKKLPYFILFSSFEDVFPEEIELATIEENEWANDLQEISDFRISSIKDPDDQTRRNHQQEVNAQFTEKFEKYWTQDPIKLQFEKDGDRIKFWIDELGWQYRPSQRSKGQQWYLAFYTKVVARINESKPNVILIDEPGLYLHARAQKDLLRILDEHTSNYPVVFSTHSPYLITEDTLENVRLVEKADSGTMILGKIHNHESASKETLTPILTAIGLGINDSIADVNKRSNVVVEGPEDVFYLQAFRTLEYPGLKWNFINGGGSGNMGIVGAILEGWGSEVVYLYDNDQGGKDGAKSLCNTWGVLKTHIKKVIDTKESSIADILSVNDFKKYVLGDQDVEVLINSQYIKSSKKNKVLLARTFLQGVKGGTVAVGLDEQSKENIRKLFELFPS